ncbi:MFS transporter [Xenorhabdus bovienii]|uniref:MFS transporter n=1 Tax=Xenorhabdus bovienii TaxID=40576 RepID=UPI0023B2C75C|nr:MFS transporter [Xenorhabdus bovienii]MDE9465239.1 MFS transporter [Xenorhabdus bovienii]MDE9499071.1 MFS transporter [Xenorhabdus bovienii]
MNSQTSSRNLKTIFYLVCFSAFLGSLAQNIYTPVIPLIKVVFNTSLPLVNLTVSAFTFVLAVMQLVYGPLIDSKGRKTVLLPSLVIFVMGSLGCAMTTDIYWLIFFRVIQAIGLGAIPVVAATIIGDLYEGQQRAKAMSTYQMLLALTPAVGPLFGGYLAELNGYVAIFQCLAIIGGLLIIGNLFWLPETKPELPTQNKKIKDHFRQILSNNISQSVFCISFMLFYCYFCLLTFLPIILSSEYHFSPADIGWMFIPMSLAMIGGSYSYRMIHQHVSQKRALVITSLLNLFIILIFAMTYSMSIAVLVTITVFYGFTLGLSMPTHATLLISEFVEERATAIGLYNFIRYTGMSAGPMISSFLLFDNHYEWIFIAGALLFALAIGLATLILKSRYQPN